METYPKLMSLRMRSRISFDLHLPVKLSDTVITPMLLLEVNGTGLGPSAQLNLQPTNHASHIGFSNIHKRLQALYGSRISLTVKQKLPHGFITQLQLPIFL